MKKKNIYSYYETPEWVCDMIAKNIYDGKLRHVIDLGAGKGQLSAPYAQIDPNIQTYSFEINAKHYESLSNINSKIFDYDIFAEKIKNRNVILNTKSSGNEGLALISNPPYGLTPFTPLNEELLKKHGLFNYKSKSKKTRKEIVFLAQALECMNKNDKGVFILPVGFITSDEWKTTRKVILENHKLSDIHVLPERAFKHTEVQTVVIFFAKNAGKSEFVNVYKYTESKSVKSEHSYLDCIQGLINQNKYSRKTNNNKKLKEYSPSFSRGRSTAKALREMSVPFLHSSDVNKHHSKMLKGVTQAELEGNDSEMIAKAGDILIARVGTRCVARVAYLKAGNMIISDCVINLRVPKSMRTKVFDRLQSITGQKWLKEHTTGSCAKILTYSTISEFPI